MRCKILLLLAPLSPEDVPMRIAATKPLFAWDALEDSPSLRTVREFLESLPDAKPPAAWPAGAGRAATTIRCASSAPQ